MNILKLGGVFLLLITLCPKLQAQPITDSSTGTTVSSPDNLQFNITGGTLSGDGANLFHSFSQFGLDANQAATFISTPAIRNILGRVTGSNPSLINGLLQVTGGNSNLFLLNPRGIIFGTNARLDVLGSFTATTATGIKVGTNWFDAFNPNNYNNLVGNVTAFRFGAVSSGAIINAANLATPTGQSLSLIGGTVLSTGSVQAPGGNIIIASVPGTSLVRLSQPGQLLSLELQLGNARTSSITPQSLPELLTGSSAVRQATGLAVNGNGAVILPGSVERAIAPNSITLAGNLDSSSDIGGDIILKSTGNLTTSDINTSGNFGGGRINLTSLSSRIDTGSLNTSATAFGNGGAVTLDAGGNITTRNITSDSITGGGDILLTSRRGEIDTRAGTLDTRGGDIRLQAARNISTANVNTSGFTGGEGGTIRLNSQAGSINTRAGRLTSNANAARSGDILLQAAQNITTGDISSRSSMAGGYSGAIRLSSDLGAIDTRAGVIDSSSFYRTGGHVRLSAAQSIQIQSLNAEGGETVGTGGNVAVTTGSFFRATGTFTAQNGQLASVSTVGGAQGGSVSIQYGGDGGSNGTAGAIVSGTGRLRINSTNTSPQVINPIPTPTAINPSPIPNQINPQSAFEASIFTPITLQPNNQNNPIRTNIRQSIVRLNGIKMAPHSSRKKCRVNAPQC